MRLRRYDLAQKKDKRKDSADEDKGSSGDSCVPG